MVKALSWNSTEEYEVEIELDGSMMKEAKRMRIELLMPESSQIDEALTEELRR